MTPLTTCVSLPGEHDSIVNQETFDEVQRQIASRQTRNFKAGERKAKPERDTPLLRGLLICGHCDRPISTSISQNGWIRYPYDRCRSIQGRVEKLSLRVNLLSPLWRNLERTLQVRQR